jgi:hypothetical protein
MSETGHPDPKVDKKRRYLSFLHEIPLVRELLISSPDDARLPKTEGGRSPEKGDSNMSDLVQEIQISLRSLMRRPPYSGLAILTLGSGIGTTPAMISTKLFGIAPGYHQKGL